MHTLVTPIANAAVVVPLAALIRSAFVKPDGILSYFSLGRWTYQAR